MKTHTRVDTCCDICGRTIEGRYIKRVTYSTLKLRASGFMTSYGSYTQVIKNDFEVCYDCLKSFTETVDYWIRTRKEGN